jgi:hypothetical protein
MPKGKPVPGATPEPKKPVEVQPPPPLLVSVPPPAPLPPSRLVGSSRHWATIGKRYPAPLS